MAALTSPPDLEKGGHDQNPPVLKSDDHHNASTPSIHLPPANQPHDHLLQLRIFQDLVGIRSPRSILMPQHVIPHGTHTADLSSSHQHQVGDPLTLPLHLLGDSGEGRPKTSLKRIIWLSFSAQNGGVYLRSMDEEFKARLGFIMTRSFLMFLYLIQIFVGATITGLSAYDGHKTTLTALGAVNTVLAGLLAFFKGQGLPNRYLKARDQYTNIIKTIEDTERMFARYSQMTEAERKEYEPFAQAKSIESLFDAAKKDQQENYPDVYVNNHERAAMDARNESNRTGLNYTPEQMAKRIDELEKQLNASTVAKAKS